MDEDVDWLRRVRFLTGRDLVACRSLRVRDRKCWIGKLFSSAGSGGSLGWVRRRRGVVLREGGGKGVEA